MKLPHWAQLLLAFLIVIITWLMKEQASGQLVLPAVATTVLTIITTALGMLTDSVPRAIAAKRARLAAMRTAGLLLFAAGLWGVFLFAAALVSACTPAEQGKGVATIAPATDAAVCIIKDVVACATAKPPTPWLQCTARTAADCGTDVATVGTIWASHKLAEAREADAGAIASMVNYP